MEDDEMARIGRTALDGFVLGNIEKGLNIPSSIFSSENISFPLRISFQP
ncbi:MAG: hypothetical protein JRD02_03025 [Deltaproteobacteria bacterium]|nr:hypothetical protein [Deltaproteobacteria bacterium]